MRGVIPLNFEMFFSPVSLSFYDSHSMKHLTIIRHAKSSWASATATDFDRPLNARGHRAAPLIARHLHETVHLKPDYVLSSPALRAISTARIIAPVLGISESEIVQNQAIYNADLQTLVYAIHEIPNAYANAMLFGHMPGVAELVQFLTGAVPRHYSTCGVAMLELHLDCWADANRSCGQLTTFLFPRMLDGAAS